MGPSQGGRAQLGGPENRFKKILANGAQNPLARQLGQFGQDAQNQLSLWILYPICQDFNKPILWISLQCSFTLRTSYQQAVIYHSNLDEPTGAYLENLRKIILPPGGTDSLNSKRWHSLENFQVFYLMSKYYKDPHTMNTFYKKNRLEIFFDGICITLGFQKASTQSLLPTLKFIQTAVKTRQLIPGWNRFSFFSS